MKVPYNKSGKCGKIVWQRNRYGPISYPFHVPANPRTEPQRRIRGSFGSVSARWRTLSELQRQSWQTAARSERTRRRLGKAFRLNGFNYFVRVNVILAHTGRPQLDLPPADNTEFHIARPLRVYRRFRQLRGLDTYWNRTPAQPSAPAPAPSG